MKLISGRDLTTIATYIITGKCIKYYYGEWRFKPDIPL